MTARDVTPWRWGLHRWGSGERSIEHLRRQIDSLHEEMEKLFDEASREGFSQSGAPKFRERGQVLLSIDQTEDEKGFHVSVEMPGLDKDDVDVSLSGRTLTIKGEKRSKKERKGKEFHRRERVFGKFRRSVELPADVDESKISASFKNGVLAIDLPKTKEVQAKTRHIDVKAA